jgi:hypothetical protein
VHTTNYSSTFIRIAEDSTATAGTVPPERGGSPSIALLTYRMISEQPYTLTSDDVIFGVHAQRQGIPAERLIEERAAFFSTGRACLRASDLGKRYGWGIHFDEHGRVALYGVESGGYARLAGGGGSAKVISAVRSRRKQ